MSYEYMSGLGALGRSDARRMPRRPTGGKGGRQRKRPDPKALMEQACGETCTNEALPKAGAIKKSLPNYDQGMANATSAGCEFACESDELTFLCCPEEWTGFRRPRQRGGQRGGPQAAPVEEEMEAGEQMEPAENELFDPSTLPEAPPENGGSSLGMIAIVGALGLGVLGIAGYFLWWKKDDDDEASDDDDEASDDDDQDADETVDEDADEE